jgi:hypothetical protein
LLTCCEGTLAKLVDDAEGPGRGVPGADSSSLKKADVAKTGYYLSSKYAETRNYDAHCSGAVPNILTYKIKEMKGAVLPAHLQPRIEHCNNHASVFLLREKRR